jgi:hypothetical protein
MKTSILSGVIASIFAASTAMAQTPTPAPAPAERVEEPSTVPPSVSAPAASADMTLTDDEAKGWVNKTIYSSDNQNIGEVAAVARDSSGKVIELHADIGGFLGLGETRVRIMPSDFKFDTDKVVLNITADQAKTLPQMPKS